MTRGVSQGKPHFMPSVCMCTSTYRDKTIHCEHVLFVHSSNCRKAVQLIETTDGLQCNSCHMDAKMGPLLLYNRVSEAWKPDYLNS